MKILKILIITICILTVYLLCGTAYAGDRELTVDDTIAVANQITAYETEIDMLAQLVYSEARGVKSQTEQAAVIWCVLNRAEAKTITEVITAKHQFAYRRNLPIKEEYRELAKDVMIRYLLEQRGVSEVGRVLPKEYIYFAGRGGRNWFRCEYRGGNYWNWALESPYED